MYGMRILPTTLHIQKSDYSIIISYLCVEVWTCLPISLSHDFSKLGMERRIAKAVKFNFCFWSTYFTLARNCTTLYAHVLPISLSYINIRPRPAVRATPPANFHHTSRQWVKKWVKKSPKLYSPPLLYCVQSSTLKRGCIRHVPILYHVEHSCRIFRPRQWVRLPLTKKSFCEIECPRCTQREDRLPRFFSQNPFFTFLLFPKSTPSLTQTRTQNNTHTSHFIILPQKNDPINFSCHSVLVLREQWKAKQSSLLK